MFIDKVLAQESQSLIELAPNPNLTTFGMLVTAIVRNAFMLAGVLSLILLIFGGFQFIVAAGDAKKAEQGRMAMTGAVTGLVLVLGSFLIIEIIEVLTGLNILSPTF
jgi:hypothetical protein